MVKQIKNRKKRRKLRSKARIVGNTKRPRLAVFRSNRYIYGQIIDDVKGVTLVSVSDSKTAKGEKKPVERAFIIGKQLAIAAKKKKITEIVFDRSMYKYHGQVKSLADGAREGGLVF